MSNDFTKPPQVVVACAWYNRADYICDTIDSLLSQDFDSFEVVVVNDGSTDPRVREILDSYHDPRLRVIHQENAGFVAAIVRAIESSDAPYIAIQGAGELSLSSRLRRQAKVLDNEPSTVLVACTAEQIYVDGKTLRRAAVTQPVDDITAKILMRGNPIIHGAAMYRRASYDNVGGYRSYFKFAQDLDLWLRLLDEGVLKIIDHLDYKRLIFKSDGVAASPDKILIQMRLADLARLSFSLKRKSGLDVVEEYGCNALLIRSGSTEVSKRTAKMAIRFYGSGDKAKSQICAELAFSENKNHVSMIVWVLSRLKLMSLFYPILKLRNV